jgi:hypothetical protein
MFDQTSVYLLLVVFATGLFISARGTWRVVSKSAVAGGWLDKLTLGLYVISLGFMAFEWLGESYLMRTGLSRAIFGSLGFVAWMGAVLAAAKTLLGKPTQNWVWGGSAALMILIGCGVSIWSYERYSRLFNHFVVFNIDACIGQVMPSDAFKGYADNGEEVELFQFNTDDRVFSEFASQFSIRYARFENALIETADADKQANCHGWVFTNGKFLLRGTGVETILRSNQYRLVTEPQANDIVIYRDVTGKILHTALVQAVLGDGTVIAESKWGIDKRVLHRPEDQPYSNRLQYYRTDRLSHSIRIVESQPAAEDKVHLTSAK